jgi:methylenetetrahydrofolate dehydrogenase (NADP+)/methenyltetrahydrofolate cyclohydrolase
MSRVLDGNEVAGFIEERQAKQVRALRQAHHVFPKLAIIQTIDNPVIDTYVRLKKRYGEDILVDVEVFKVDQAELNETIQKVNDDPAFHGMIIQLPLADESKTDEAVNLVASAKDVDGLGEQATLTPATPQAIMWLLAAYNVDLKGKKIVLVGKGRLVGAPLAKIWEQSGYSVTTIDSNNSDLERSSILKEADIIVTATGTPGLIRSNDIKIGAVVVDAGTAAEHGKIVGDVADEVRERDDITMTPIKGGVGPLTVVALFDNVIQAASKTVEEKTN